MAALSNETEAYPSLPLEGRAGVGVALWFTEEPAPSIPSLKEEGRTGATCSLQAE
jgi:hypothetical protein